MVVAVVNFLINNIELDATPLYHYYLGYHIITPLVPSTRYKRSRYMIRRPHDDEEARDDEDHISNLGGGGAEGRQETHKKRAPHLVTAA